MRSISIGQAAVLVLWLTANMFAGEWIWLEAEKPSRISEKIAGAEKIAQPAKLLSGQLLQIHIPAEKTGETLAGGQEIAYEFTVKNGGKFEVWSRLAYEFVRSPFSWRIDSGEWQEVTPDRDLTTDLVVLGHWFELGWLRLAADANLEAGAHTLTLRLLPPKTVKDGKETPQRFLNAFDAFCLYQGAWRPDGANRPDAPAFTLPAPQPVQCPAGDAASVSLAGSDWSFARWDENGNIPEESRLQPVQELPAALDSFPWRSFTLPGVREQQYPEAAFAHRYFLRKKITLPAGCGGRAVRLNIENFNMLVSVFLNGKFCGWSKNHNTRFVCDVTSAVKPGETNDLVLVFKDVYYAIASADRPFGVRSHFNLPIGMLSNSGISFRFDMPVSWDKRSGIFDGISLDIAAGAVWTADAFVKTSVKEKRIDVDFALINSGMAAANITLKNRIVLCDADGRPTDAKVKELADKTLSLQPNQETPVSVGDVWADAVLWWPDAPQLYQLITEIYADGEKISDRRTTRFGFREWDWRSSMFTLNGVDWPMWADTQNSFIGDKEKHLAWRQKVGARMVRLWQPDSRRRFLDFCDTYGMPVRVSGVFDGEVAAYGLREKDESGKMIARKILFKNWEEQLLAQIKEERNHPSAFIWSIENEITFINSRNLGQAKEVEPAIRAVAAKVESLDPTRPTMVDGGNALLDQSMPVNGVHYGETFKNPWRNYPDGFYTNDCFFSAPQTDSWNIWPMAPNKPIFHGEIFFASGIAPANFALLGGEQCFAGIAWTDYARGLFYRMNSEGYRWNGTAAWHYWNGGLRDEGYCHSWKEVAVLCRQWNWTFGPGEKVTRTLRLFNSTRHASPITVTCALLIDGRAEAPFTREFTVAPGKYSEFAVEFTVPALTKETAAVYRLQAVREGKEVFREDKPVRILLNNAPAPRLKAEELAVFDPAGSVIAYLQGRKIPFTPIPAFEQLKETAKNAKVIVVGKNAVTEKDCAASLWLQLADSGKRLLVLEQEFPLRYQAVNADVEPTQHTGRIAFFEDPTHPAAAGLTNADLFCWNNDHINYRSSYRKATRGARSLIQCDEKLGDSALVEISVGSGLQTLCQMAVGEKLATNIAAQKLFANLLQRSADYVHTVRPVSVCVPAASQLRKALSNIALQYDPAANPLAALEKPQGIAVVDGSKENLAALTGAADKVRAFTQGGGWLMLCNVAPDGLAALNKLTGAEQIMRPFAAERVSIAIPRDPLTSGLTLRDVALYTGKSLVGFSHIDEPVNDLFSHVVDYDEIGGFAKLPRPTELGKPSDTDPGVDHRPENLINGFTADDFWTFAYMINLQRGDATKIPFTFPREETFTGFSIMLNVIYHKATKLHLFFDDNPEPLVLDVRPTHDRQDFLIPERKAKKVTLEIAGWEKSGRANVAGIDNVWFNVQRSEDFRSKVKCLFNVGGIVRYPQGKGGIILNQVLFKNQEINPVNTEKKQNILSTVLRNLDAPFTAGNTVVAGEGLRYRPVKFAPAQFTAHLTHQGTPPWYAGSGDLSHLPTGEQKFADVLYHIADFKTSPVPGAAMLCGFGAKVKEQRITGIAVGGKADALFFLHTFNPDMPALERALRENKAPVLWSYIVHYADGAKTEIPMYWQEDTGAWNTAAVKPLKNAAAAWQGALPGGDKRQAVLYSRQWNNPHPEKVITSVDFVSGPENGRYGSPALLGITAGVKQTAKIAF